MEISRSDFLGQYKLISSKLKKRFLRKPNVAEASEQFNLLIKDLQQQECSHYAAFCCLAVARCEHSLGNLVGETYALVHAAHLFLEEEQQNHLLHCPGFDEYLNGAVSCYNHAVSIHLEQKRASLAASLCLELGDALCYLGQTAAAVPHYQKASELQNQCPLDYITALNKMASCKIKTGDYEGALSLLTEIAQVAEEKGSGNNGKPVGVYTSILAETEVNCVLLLLRLQPAPQKLRPELTRTMEKYAWQVTDGNSTGHYLSDDLFLLLQSVVMACQSDDLDTLKALQVDIWPLLSGDQNQLLHELVLRHSVSSG